MEKRKKLIFTLMILVIMGCFLFTIGQAADFTMKLSHGDPEGPDPTHVACVKFKELLEEYTNGGIEVVIYPNNVLGNEQEVAQAVRQGNIHGEKLATANLQPMAPSIGVLQLPYLFTEHEEAWAILDAAMPRLRERVIDEAGVRIVSLFEKGFRVMTNSKKPVEYIDDLQGLKIRTSKSKAPIETFRAWGLEVIPMAWDEVFSAMQQRVIDGQENPYTAALTGKFYEVQKYITEIHYTLWTGPLIVSEKWYQELPVEYQEAVTKAGLGAADYERQYSLEMTEETKKELEELGMILLGPPKDEEIWKEKAMEIWPMFYDDFGGEEWVMEFMAIAEEAAASVNQ